MVYFIFIFCTYAANFLLSQLIHCTMEFKFYLFCFILIKQLCFYYYCMIDLFVVIDSNWILFCIEMQYIK